MNSDRTDTPEIRDLTVRMINEGTVPRYLYKYRTIGQVKQLLNNPVIYFSKTSDFNDPYEGIANVDADNNVDDWYDYLVELGIPQLEAMYKATRLARDKAKADATVKKAIGNAQEEVGVYCLSSIPSSILMWSHYADQHKGACVRFDLTKDIGAFVLPKKVEYTADLLHYNYLKHKDGATETLYRKFQDWAYEQEYRIIKIGYQGLYNIKPLCIDEIIFGCKTPQTDIDDIQKLVKSKGFQHISFLKMTMDDDKYELKMNAM